MYNFLHKMLMRQSQVAQRSLAAGGAAGSSGLVGSPFRQTYQRPRPAGSIGLPSPPTFASTGQRALLPALLAAHSSNDASYSTSTAGSSSSNSGRSSEQGTGCFSSPQHAEDIDVAGEVFLFSWLRQKVPGVTGRNWLSSNRVHWPGPEQLPPATQEPFAAFQFTDTEGSLTGQPGTLCYADCKATAEDLDGSSSSSSQVQVSLPLTTREWDLAQDVYSQRLAGAACQYIIFIIDRVGRPDGPRVAAMLVDPVQMLGQGQIRLTGEDLSLEPQC